MARPESVSVLVCTYRVHAVYFSILLPLGLGVTMLGLVQVLVQVLGLALGLVLV